MTDTVHQQVLTMLKASIIERYDGDLKRHEDPRMKRSDWYTPRDTAAIRKLLTTLWGAHVTAQTIEQAFDELIKYGARQWPLAHCQEDDEEAAEAADQRISDLDHEIEYTEEHLANLKDEQARLIREYRSRD